VARAENAVMQTLRSTGAVLAGYLTFGISAALLFGLTGVDPNAAAPMSFMVLTALYGIAFAILGGYLAAKIANELSEDRGPCPAHSTRRAVMGSTLVARRAGR